MRAEILLGIILGAPLGVIITKAERDMSARKHAVIGSIVGASLGGLLIARLTESKSAPVTRREE